MENTRRDLVEQLLHGALMMGGFVPSPMLTVEVKTMVNRLDYLLEDGEIVIDDERMSGSIEEVIG